MLLRLNKKITIQSISRVMLRPTRTLSKLCHFQYSINGLQKIQFPQLNNFNNKYIHFENKQQNDLKKSAPKQATVMFARILKAVQADRLLFDKYQKDINVFFQIIPKAIQEMSKQDLFNFFGLLNRRSKFFRLKRQNLYEMQDAFEKRISELICPSEKYKHIEENSESFQRQFQRRGCTLSNLQIIELIGQLLQIKQSINNKNHLLNKLGRINFNQYQFQLLIKKLAPKVSSNSKSQSKSGSNTSSKLEIQRLFRIFQKSSEFYQKGSVFVLKSAIFYQLEMILDSEKIVKYSEKVMHQIDERWKLKQSLVQKKEDLFQSIWNFFYCLVKIQVYHNDARLSKCIEKTYNYFTQISKVPINIRNQKEVQQSLSCIYYMEKLLLIYPKEIEAYTQSILNGFLAIQIPEVSQLANLANFLLTIDKLVYFSDKLKKNHNAMSQLWRIHVKIFQNLYAKKIDFIVYARILQFIAIISQNVQVKDQEKNEFMTAIKKLDEKVQNYKYYELVRLWAVYRKLRIPSNNIQKMYQYLKINQPTAVAENLMRTLLYRDNIPELEQIYEKNIKQIVNNSFLHSDFWKICICRAKYLIDKHSFTYSKIIANDINICRMLINFLQADNYVINSGQFQLVTHLALQKDLSSEDLTEQIIKITKFGKLNDVFTSLRHKKVDSAKTISFFTSLRTSKNIAFLPPEQKANYFKYLINILKNSQYDAELVFYTVQISIQAQLQANRHRINFLHSLYRYLFHESLKKGYEFFFNNKIIFQGFAQNFQSLFYSTTCVFDQIQLFQGLQEYIRQKNKQNKALQFEVNQLDSFREIIIKNDSKIYELSSMQKSPQEIQKYSNLQIYNFLCKNIDTPNLELFWKRVNKNFLSSFGIESICILLRKAYKYAGKAKNQDFLPQLQQITETLFNCLDQHIIKQIKKDQDLQNSLFSKEYLEVYLLYMRKPNVSNLSIFFDKKIKQFPCQLLSIVKNLLPLNIVLKSQTIATVLKHLNEQNILRFYNRFFPDLGQSRLADLNSYLLLCGTEAEIKYFYDKVLLELIRQERSRQGNGKPRNGIQIITQKLSIELMFTKVKFPKLIQKVQSIQSILSQTILNQNIINYFQDFKVNQQYLRKKSKNINILKFKKIVLEIFSNSVCIQILRNDSTGNYELLTETYDLISGKYLRGNDSLLFDFLQTVVKGKILLSLIQPI